VDKLEAAFGHLGNLSEGELRDKIRSIRKDRRTSKVRATVKKKIRATSDTARTKLTKLMSGMSPAEREKLMKMLGAEPDGD
jgi:hypothetical protein